MTVKLKLQIKGVEIELDEAEAKELAQKLAQLTGAKPGTLNYYPVYYPPVYVRSPRVTWSTNEGDTGWTTTWSSSTTDAKLMTTPDGTPVTTER